VKWAWTLRRLKEKKKNVTYFERVFEGTFLRNNRKQKEQQTKPVLYLFMNCLSCQVEWEELLPVRRLTAAHQSHPGEEL
jgi:hypothetical protein